MKLLRKNAPASEPKMAEPTPEREVGMPAFNVTLGHIGAIAFSEAVIAQDWNLAEQLWSAESCRHERAHMLGVAIKIGGRPTQLDRWVEGSKAPALALTIRGSMGVQWAWDARSGYTSDRVSREMFEEFFGRLRTAEADLLAAAAADAESPHPWVQLLSSGRGLQIPQEEIDERYTKMFERGELFGGHTAYQQSVCAKWSGSNQKMWEFTMGIFESAPPGDPVHGLVAGALMEELIDPNVYPNRVEYFAGSSKRALLRQAANKSYGHPDFPVPTPRAAQSMSMFLSVFWITKLWPAAQGVLPQLGDRFTGSPLNYVNRRTWPEQRAFIEAQ